MARMDVGNGIQPAWENVVRVLFRPFSARKWLSLGFISLLAYGLNGGGGGGGNFPSNWGNQQPNWPPHNPFPWIMHWLPLIIVGCLLFFAFCLLVGWIASVMHFVYMDDIVRSSGAIAEPWSRLKGRGTSYFLWRLLFGLAFMVLFFSIAGVTAVAAVAAYSAHNIPIMVLAIIGGVIVTIPLAFLSVIIDLFVRDFVSTVMYVRGVGIMEGWHVAWPIIKENVGQVALYMLILIAMAFVIGMFAIVMMLIVAMIVGIPIALIIVAAVLMAKALGLGWSAPVIVAAIVLGIPVMAGFIYLVNTVTQPADVFRRSYALVIMGQADPSLVTIPTGKTA